MRPLVVFSAAGARADVGTDANVNVDVSANDDDSRTPSRGGSLYISCRSACMSMFMSRAAVSSHIAWSISSLET